MSELFLTSVTVLLTLDQVYISLTGVDWIWMGFTDWSGAIKQCCTEYRVSTYCQHFLGARSTLDILTCHFFSWLVYLNPSCNVHKKAEIKRIRKRETNHDLLSVVIFTLTNPICILDFVVLVLESLWFRLFWNSLSLD